MASELEKLKDDLLGLPPDSRASLAFALIASLEEEIDEDADRLWEEEIRRRHRDIKSGRATLKPADQVLVEARERLRCLK
jgi:hypothetical protein